MNNYVERIYNIAKIYKNNFQDKKIKVIYRDKYNKRKNLTLIFDGKNLMHLVGVKSYKTSSNNSTYKNKSGGAKNFYIDCINNNLDTSQCTYENIYLLEQKIIAMENIHLLLSDSTSIGGQGSFDKLFFDYVFRTNKNILAVTFIEDRKNNYLFPNSCINLRHGLKHTSKAFRDTMKVTSIEIYDKNDVLIDTIKSKKATPKKYKKKRR